MGSVASILDSTSEFFGHYWRSAVAGLPSPIMPLTRAATSVAPAPPRTAPDLSTADLAQLIETEIIPRLMLAHQPTLDATAAGAMDMVAVTEVFTDLVLRSKVDDLLAFVDALLLAGRSVNALYLDLFAPTAQRLGDYWDEDRISFADVTIGVGRLQHLVRALGADTDQMAEDTSRTAYFIPSPSEQHTFGLFILEDIFQRAGWRTSIETRSTDAQTIGAVRTQWFDLLGVSASREDQIDEVAATIKAARRASRNPDLFILVGGRLFIEQPEIVSAVGADAAAISGDQALLVADEIVMRRA